MSSSLQLDNAEIVRAVLQITGLGRDASNLDSATEADVRSIIRSGLRRFFFPTSQGFTYQWRFLEQEFDVTAEAVFDDGTVEVSGGTVTLTGGTWPADIVDYYIDVDSHILFVDTRTDDNNIEVSHTQLTVDSGTSYEAKRFKYDLPSDFGEFLGGVVYANESTNKMLIASSAQELKLRYAIGYSLANETSHYAVMPADKKIMFWPVPTPDAFIHGIYMQIPEDNLPADLTTPGSVVQVQPIYAEAVLEAILAAAEAYNDDNAGIHEQRLKIALQSAISHDRATGGHYSFSHRVPDGFKGHGPVVNISFEED